MSPGPKKYVISTEAALTATPLNGASLKFYGGAGAEHKSHFNLAPSWQVQVLHLFMVAITAFIRVIMKL